MQGVPTSCPGATQTRPRWLWGSSFAPEQKNAYCLDLLSSGPPSQTVLLTNGSHFNYDQKNPGHFRCENFDAYLGCNRILPSCVKKKFVFGALIGMAIAFKGTTAERVEILPQTSPLEWDERDLSTRLMDGAHRFIERRIDDSVTRRGQFWSRDFSSPAAYVNSVQPNRERFRTIIGAVDLRVRPRMEQIGRA